jgi:hypothetical protein
MEKIREELRRGYPQPSAKAANKESEAPPSSSRPNEEPPARKSTAEPQQPKSARETAEHPERALGGDQPAQQKPPQTSAKRQEHNDAPAPSADREQRKQAPPERPSGDRGRPFEQRSKPFYPPPFTHPAEQESPLAAEKSGSAFLKGSAPPSASVPVPADNVSASFSASQQPAAMTSEPSRSREEAHASAETLRRPFRPEPRSTHRERPYIPPPVDESFEAAWERAKLTAPEQSPHLSRAAAGSIIGIALAVILGALAFNFREDIGALVIDLGQKISGGNQAVAPSSSPASMNKPESSAAADPGSSATSAPSDKPDAAGSQTASAPNTGSANSSTESRSSDSPTQHEAPPATAREANPIARRHGTTPTPAANGKTNNSSGGNITDSGASSVPTGNTAAAIATEAGSGQEEFNVAREMLKGDYRHRDLSRAVDLLWAGVRKGYVPAEVTLADLYRRGDGVTKNCDQAQVLLVAASKKGSPEARQMLEQMAEEGCSD